MKREVERAKKLPAFSVTMGELETLWRRLESLFEGQEDISSSLTITLSNETLEFKNVEELKQYEDLKGKITKFSVWLSKAGRRVSIRTSSLFYGRATVSGTAENESWCAGAVETVYSFTQSHKVWYSWFTSPAVGWVLLLLVNVSVIIIPMLLMKGSLSKTMTAGWIATLIAFVFLFFSRRKLFPTLVLSVTEENSFIRRYSAELGLIIALISAILTVVGLLMRR